MEKMRCPWAKSEKEIAYHDLEWCRPVHDDRKIFEMLILEGMQAGLSWSTILNKRDHMKEAFDGFEPGVIARYGEEKLEELMADPGIIRNRRKLEAMIGNAVHFLEVQKERGSFDAYIWEFVQGTPIDHGLTDAARMPAQTELSGRISRDLKKRGFRFVGSTICYSFMQGIGMINDHLLTCPCHDQDF